MGVRNVVKAAGARLLRKVARHILAEPERYEQNEIVRYGSPGDPFRNQHFPACGTVACIGGWLYLLTRKRRLSERQGIPFRLLARQLGVTQEQFSKLVNYTWNKGDRSWPRQLSAAYEKAKTPLAKARIANRRIEHFIRTGE